MWQDNDQCITSIDFAARQEDSDCLARGVERGLFAYALGDGEAKQFDTILFRKTVEPSKCEITESAWLLRPDLAKSLILEPVVIQPSAGSGASPVAVTVTGGTEPPAEVVDDTPTRTGQTMRR